MNIHIFIVQLKPSVTKEELFKKIENFVMNAVYEKSSMILFPELTYSQWGNSLQQRTKDGPQIYMKSLEHMKYLTTKYNICMIAGTYIKENNKLYNRMYVWNKGNIITKYDKIHPFTQEIKNNVKKGETLSIFNYKGFKFGIQICYDIRFPEISLSYCNYEPDIILCPSAWLDKDITGDEYNKILNVRSMDTLCYIVSADMTGKIGNIKWKGNSCYSDPLGNIYRTTDMNELGFPITLNKNKIKKAKKLINIWPRKLKYYSIYPEKYDFFEGYKVINKMNKIDKKLLQSKINTIKHPKKCIEMLTVPGNKKIQGCFDASEIDWTNQKDESNYCSDGKTKKMNKLGTNCKNKIVCVNVPKPGVCAPKHYFTDIDF